MKRVKCFLRKEIKDDVLRSMGNRKNLIRKKSSISQYVRQSKFESVGVDSSVLHVELSTASMVFVAAATQSGVVSYWLVGQCRTKLKMVAEIDF